MRQNIATHTRALRIALRLVAAWFCLAQGALAQEGQAQHGSGALAEPASDDVPEGYLEAARLGAQEYGLGNYPEARARFLEAHRAYPNARSLRALGAVEYDLKNYVASVDYLRRALDSEVRRLEGRLRTETERLLVRAAGYVATYTVVTTPPDARLELDGRGIERAPDGTVMIEVGDHVLTARARGYREASKSIHVASGQEGSVNLELVARAESAPDSRDGRTARRKRWAWTLVGVVAAGAVAGLAVGLSGREKVGAPTPSSLDEIPEVRASW